MRKTMFLIVSLMLMVTPTHAKAMINFISACKAIENEIDWWFMAISLDFAESGDQRAIAIALDPQAYENNTKMAERWATIYTAKCPVKKQ